MQNEFLEMLKTEHDNVKDIMEQIKELNAKDVNRREDLFNRLMQEILPHMIAEERVLYSSLKSIKNARKDTLESIEEHRLARMVLEELKKMPKNDLNWVAKFNVCREMIEHHIEEEEDRIFEDARENFKGNQMQDIQRRFQEEKDRVVVTIK